VGAGLSALLVCDLRIASPKAKLGSAGRMEDARAFVEKRDPKFQKE
jgi:1,4-dihydroxy-2-naphthoyl-CoA synthase